MMKNIWKFSAGIQQAILAISLAIFAGSLLVPMQQAIKGTCLVISGVLVIALILFRGWAEKKEYEEENWSGRIAADVANSIDPVLDKNLWFVGMFGIMSVAFTSEISAYHIGGIILAWSVTIYAAHRISVYVASLAKKETS